MKKFKSIFYILVIVFLFFLFLEVSLRFTGWLYYKFRDRPVAVFETDTQAFKILCLGDSFTFGSGARSDQSYPSQLEAMLNNAGKGRFEVINRGGCIPGINTSLILRNLEADLIKYRPKLILVMAGMHNDWNFQSSNYFLFAGNSLRSYFLRMDSFFTQFRIYKLLKIILGKLEGVIFSNISKRSLKTTALVDSPKDARPALGKDIEEKIEFHLKSAENYSLQSNLEAVMSELNKVIEFDPDHEFAHSELGCIYENKKHYFYAINEFKKVIQINPNNLFARNRLFGLYIKLGEKELALKEIEEIQRIDPSYRDVASQVKSYLHFNKDLNDRKAQNELLDFDLSQIVYLAQKYGAKTMILSYPGYNKRDAIRSRVAKKTGAYFIDIFKIFSNLEPRNRYFVVDGHCNALGYKIIAERIFEELSTRKIIGASI